MEHAQTTQIKFSVSKSTSYKSHCDEDYPEQKNALEIIYKKLGYTFKNSTFLTCALTIIAVNKDNQVKENYKALATLGDGFLRAIIEDILLEMQTDLSKGHLSFTRDKLVNNKYQAEIAKKLKLVRFLITDSTKSSNTITDKMLADCLEAIIGAVFLDSDRDYLITKKLVIQLWELKYLYNHLLIVAVKQKDRSKVKYLLNCGADPNLKLPYFLFPEQDVAYFELPKDLNLDNLNKGTFVTNLLCEIATQSEAEMVELFLTYGADIDSKNLLGHSPLYNACYSGYTHLVALLINYKATISGSLADSYTPLHIAISQNHTEIVELLLDKTTADVNHLTPFGKTPLLIATVKGHLLIAEILLKHGALLNMACADRKNKKFTTVLHAAIENDHIDILNLFINHQVNLNVINDKKQTPLHVAVLKGNVMAIKILVEHGAVTSAVDDAGKTPCDLTNDLDIKHLLLLEPVIIAKPVAHKKTPSFFKNSLSIAKSENELTDNQAFTTTQASPATNKVAAEQSILRFCAIL